MRSTRLTRAAGEDSTTYGSIFGVSLGAIEHKGLGQLPVLDLSASKRSKAVSNLAVA